MFYYYPASLPRHIVQLGLRYRPYRAGRLSYRVTSVGTWVYLPDRDLFVSNSSLASEDFDEIVVLDFDSFGIDRYLVTIHDLISPRLVWRLQSYRVKSMLDSGGAQIYSGVLDYVDPVKLVLLSRLLKTYISISLDFPPRRVALSKTQARAGATLQRKVASRYFHPSANQINWLVPIQCKGYDWMFNIWLDTVWEDWYKGAGLSCPYPTLFKYVPILHQRTKVDKIHLFAQGSASKFYYLAWLGRYVPELSADSSTPISRANFRLYFCALPGGAFVQLPVGLKASSDLTIDQPLTCSCPACRAVKWAGAWTISASAVSRILSWHNAYHYMQLATYLSEFTSRRDLELKDYAEFLKSIGRFSPDFNWLEYVTVFYEDSPKEARRLLRFLKSKATQAKSISSVWGEAVSSNQKILSHLHRVAKFGLDPVLSCYLPKEEVVKLGLKWVKPTKVSTYLTPVERYKRREIYYRRLKCR